jgi:UDP-N-acetylmuramoyl-tripeptide--D-alanyl-D-alanine ligase
MQQLEFTVDSRQKNKNGFFFALKGAKTDGHLFLKEAKANGAKAAYVSLGYEGNDFGLELHRVEDPLKTLQKLARQKIHAASPFIIGVTGSYGKTTTKEALYQAFSRQKKCFRNPLNQNSQIGLPLSILNFYGNEPLVFLEMGIENPGDMENLVAIATPDVVVITRIAEAHLDTLKTLENIASEKGKIVVYPKTKVQFVHHSASRFYPNTQNEELRQIIYGQMGEPLFGDVHDLIEKMGEILGVSPLPTKWETPDLRYQTKMYRKGRAILDCYNANPTTMRIFFLAEHKISTDLRRVAIIGQMESLGEQTEYYHMQLALDLQNSFDVAFCIGKKMQPVFDVWKKQAKLVFWVETVEQLGPIIKQQIQPKDFVLVKGSNVNRLWEVEPWLEQALNT